MLKNDKRFVETFKNNASCIHTFSLTDNFQNSRKKGKRRKKTLEAIFQRCSIRKVFLKLSQNSQENTCAKQKQHFRGVLEKRCSENMQQICRGVSTPKCDFNKVAKRRCFPFFFFWLLRDFWEHLFLKNTSGGCFCTLNEY